MRSQKQPQKKQTKASMNKHQESSESSESNNSEVSEEIDVADMQEDAMMEEFVKEEEEQNYFTTKGKKQMKNQKRIHKLYAQNNSISSSPSSSSYGSQNPQLPQLLSTQFLLAEWAKHYIDFIAGSYWKECNDRSLGDFLLELDITAKIRNQYEIVITQEVENLITLTRREMHRYFTPEHGVSVDKAIFNKKCLLNSSCQIRHPNYYYQIYNSKQAQQAFLFSFCPTRAVTGKMFYRFVYEECSDNIIYGRPGIGKTTSTMLYIMLSNKIHYYEGLEQKERRKYDITGNYKKILYWHVEGLDTIDLPGQRLKFLKNLCIILKSQCSDRNLKPSEVSASGVMNFEQYQFEILRNLCEEIRQCYKNVYIFVDQFDVIVSAIEQSNKKVEQLLKSQKLLNTQEIMLGLKTKQIFLKEYEVSQFYLKILGIVRASKIDLIFNTSTNIDEKYLRNYASNEGLHLYIQIGTTQCSYNKIKIEYQELRKEWIVEQMVHLFKFWMRYKLSITGTSKANSREQRFSPIEYLKEYHKELNKKMGNKKMIDVPTPAIVFEAINGQIPFLQEVLSSKQKFREKCEQLIKIMGIKLKQKLRQIFRRIGRKDLCEEYKLINMQLVQQYFNVGDQNSLIISFSDVLKNIKHMNSQQIEMSSVLDLGIYTTNFKEIICNIKAKYFKREFVDYLATLSGEEGEKIMYRLMATLPESEEGIYLEDCFMMGLSLGNSFASPQLDFNVTKKMGFGELPEGKFSLKKELKQITQYLSANSKEDQTILALPFKNELYQYYNQLESEQEKNKCFAKNKLRNSTNCDCILIQKSHQKQVWNFILITTKSKKSKIQERFNKLMKILSKVDQFNSSDQSASNPTVRVFLMIKPNMLSESRLLSKLKRKTEQRVLRIVQNVKNMIINLEKTKIEMSQMSIHVIAYNWIIQNKLSIQLEGADQKNQNLMDNEESSNSLD